jgi:hypothetical protein
MSSFNGAFREQSAGQGSATFLDKQCNMKMQFSGLLHAKRYSTFQLIVLVVWVLTQRHAWIGEALVLGRM